MDCPVDKWLPLLSGVTWDKIRIHSILYTEDRDEAQRIRVVRSTE